MYERVQTPNGIAKHISPQRSVNFHGFISITSILQHSHSAQLVPQKNVSGFVYRRPPSTSRICTSTSPSSLPTETMPASTFQTLPSGLLLISAGLPHASRAAHTCTSSSHWTGPTSSSDTAHQYKTTQSSHDNCQECYYLSYLMLHQTVHSSLFTPKCNLITF